MRLGGAPAYKYWIQGKSILELCKSIYGMFRGGFMKKSVVYCRWNFRLSFISVIQLKLLTQLCFHSFQPNFPGRLLAVKFPLSMGSTVVPMDVLHV